MDVLRQDVRSALVAMRRAPGFAATALITLALGVGATTAVFSIVHGVLLRPLPYAAPDRLVRLWEEYPGGVSPAGNRWLSRSTYAVWRERTRTLDALGGYALFEYQLAFGSEGFKVFGARVSPAVLGTLGVAPALGRFLTDDDDREGAPPVVIISDGLWRERYGSSPGVLGASLVIDGDAHTIVGVAPPAFEFPEPRVRFWLPYVIPRSAAAPTGAIVFTALARLKPGVTLAQAEAEGTAAARAAPPHRLTELFFGKGGPVVVHARALVDDMTASGAAGVVDPGRRRCARAADCVRQRHEPAAVARRDASSASWPSGRPSAEAARGSCGSCSPRAPSFSIAGSALGLAAGVVARAPAAGSSRRRRCRAWTAWRSMARS